MNKIIYVIILNWNGESDTIACLDSIISNTKECDYNIILVDNGSEISGINALRDFCNNNFNSFLEVEKENIIAQQEFILKKNNGSLLFIKNNENLGFACGNNVAIELLNSLNAQYTLLLNNDTELCGDSISMMLASIKERSCAAIIPQIRYYDPSDVIWNCGGYINKLGVRKYLYANVNIKNVSTKGLIKVDYGTGCALMIDLFKLKGELSDKYFFGEEDFEFALRMRRQNESIYCDMDTIIYHKVGASRKKLTEDRLGHFAYHYTQRLHNLKNYLNPFVWWLSVVMHMLSSLRLVISSKIFNFSSFINLWKEIVKISSTENKITKDIFMKLTQKKY